jgi:hypothetical protein
MKRGDLLYRRYLFQNRRSRSDNFSKSCNEPSNAFLLLRTDVTPTSGDRSTQPPGFTFHFHHTEEPLSSLKLHVSISNYYEHSFKSHIFGRLDRCIFNILYTQDFTGFTL